MAPVLKTGIPERVSGVRIPPSPPFMKFPCDYQGYVRFLLFASLSRRAERGEQNCNAPKTYTSRKRTLELFRQSCSKFFLLTSSPAAMASSAFSRRSYLLGGHQHRSAFVLHHDQGVPPNDVTSSGPS